jgi:TonB family protein
LRLTLLSLLATAVAPLQNIPAQDSVVRNKPADPFSEIPSASAANLVKPLQLRTNSVPEYPNRALRKGECGTVYLQVHVSADSVVTETQVAVSSGVPALDEAAVQHARLAWRFTAAQIAGAAQDAQVLRPVNFSIEDGCKKQHVLTPEEQARVAELTAANEAAWAARVSEFEQREQARYAREEPYRVQPLAGLKDEAMALLAYQRFAHFVHCGTERYDNQDGIINQYHGVRLRVTHVYKLSDIDRLNQFQWKGLVAFQYEREREYRPEASGRGWGDWQAAEQSDNASRLVYKKAGQWFVQTVSTDAVGTPFSCAAVPPG